ncbi:hypothetical protein HN587_05900 [Candidatus Woesearchaeota archaeon]|jgi:hypothetical protein|nr:hypothetical protein [Candidatus Woesearchaeota archaeon]
MSFLESIKNKSNNGEPELDLPPLPTEDEFNSQDFSQELNQFPQDNMNPTNTQQTTVPELDNQGLPPLPQQVQFPTQPNAGHDMSTIPPLDLGNKKFPIPPPNENSLPKLPPINPMNASSAVAPQPIQQYPQPGQIGNSPVENTNNYPPTQPMPQPNSQNQVTQIPEVPDLDDLPEPVSQSTRQENSQTNFNSNSQIPKSVPSLEGFPNIYEEINQMPQSQRMASGPVFVLLDDYRNILDNFNQIKIKFKEEETKFTAINNIKIKKEIKLEAFRETIEDIQRKLLFIDKVLFEG